MQVEVAEELHKRTLVRRIKEHYTGKFGTGCGNSAYTNGLLSLGDPLSAFRPTPSRISTYRKPSAGHRATTKSHTFSYFTPHAWTGVEEIPAARELKALSSLQEQVGHPAAPQSSTLSDSPAENNTIQRKTSAGELDFSGDDAIWQQESLQRRPATAAPSSGIPSAQAPETSVLREAESGDAAAQETIVRVLLSSFMKPETLLASGVLITTYRLT